MKNNFSKEVIIMLKKVGWYEGRHIDISKVETKFNDKGIKLFPVAREIL